MVLWKQRNMKQKKEDGFLGAMMAPMTTSLIVPMAFSLKQHVASEIVLVLLHNIEITSLGLMVFFQEIIYLERKIEHKFGRQIK